MFTERLYTSQRYMTGIGLYNYNARFYSATLGRFVSADTVVANPFNPQNLNRFSYANNSPVNFSDPSGHFICSSDINSDDYCPNHGSTIGTTTGSYSGGGGSSGGDEEGEVTGNDNNTSTTNSESFKDELVDILYTGANAAETFLGLVSFTLTGTADLIDDGEFGEATATSGVTLTAGSLMVDPIGDLIIDGYASGYNHGIYSGIISLMNGEPLLQE